MNILLRFLLLLAFSCKPLFSEESRVVLITGASRGVGLATAELLAEKGFRVYAGVRTVGTLVPKKNLHFELLDVTNSSQIQKVAQKIIHDEGSIDILINNAGYALGGAVECLTMEEISAQMDVNFLGIIRTTQAVLPQMRKQKKGHIINISSEQGVYGFPYGSLYTASKAALESLSEALCIEVIPWNIKVSIIEPGLLTTRFSIVMGTRNPDGSPYQKVTDSIKKSLKERDEHPELLTPSQTPQEIALFLQKVIDDPNPKLRYQTSQAATESVSKYIVDLSGQEHYERNKMAAE